MYHENNKTINDNIIRKYSLKKSIINYQLDNQLDNNTFFYNKLRNCSIATTIDLRCEFNEVSDQLDISSCTSQAFGSLYEYHKNIYIKEYIYNEDNKKLSKKYNFYGSKLFLYYNQRLLTNSIDIDDGGSLLDGIKSLKTYGVCSIDKWSDNNDNLFLKPSKEAYNEANNDIYFKINGEIVSKITTYNILFQVNSMKYFLNKKIPFVFGINAYESFNNNKAKKTGFITIPKKNELCEGGHALLCVGYDDNLIDTDDLENNYKGYFIVRNSWGKSWGDNGYCYIPYDYFNKNLIFNDIWSIKINNLNNDNLNYKIDVLEKSFNKLNKLKKD